MGMFLIESRHFHDNRHTDCLPTGVDMLQGLIVAIVDQHGDDTALMKLRHCIAACLKAADNAFLFIAGWYGYRITILALKPTQGRLPFASRSAVVTRPQKRSAFIAPPFDIGMSNGAKSAFRFGMFIRFL